MKTFEVIEDHFEGMEDIAIESLNLINYSEAWIQVKHNLCDFMPTTIEITNFNRGNTFLNFCNIEPMDSPSITVGC